MFLIYLINTYYIFVYLFTPWGYVEKNLWIYLLNKKHSCLINIVLRQKSSSWMIFFLKKKEYWSEKAEISILYRGQELYNEK